MTVRNFLSGLNEYMLSLPISEKIKLERALLKNDVPESISLRNFFSFSESEIIPTGKQNEEGEPLFTHSVSLGINQIYFNRDVEGTKDTIEEDIEKSCSDFLMAIFHGVVFGGGESEKKELQGKYMGFQPFGSKSLFSGTRAKAI